MHKKRITQHLLPFIELLNSKDSPYFYFAGGCLRDILLGRRINDYDIFTTSEDDANKLMDILLSLGFQQLYKTKHSTKFSFLNSMVEVSTEFFVEPDKLFEFYDFTINCIALDNHYRLFYHKTSLEHLSDLSLVRINTGPPLLELRYVKFLSDGFYGDFTPIEKIEDLNIKTEKMFGGSYPKINLQKFCNNKL